MAKADKEVEVGGLEEIVLEKETFEPVVDTPVVQEAQAEQTFVGTNMLPSELEAAYLEHMASQAAE